MKFLLACYLSLICCAPLAAAELFGTIDAITGSASMAGSSTSLSQDQKVYEGDTINTGSDGEIHIATADGGFVAIRPNSIFKVDEYQANGEDGDKVAMSLLKGALRSITGWIGKHNPSAYRLNTPNAVIGIRGTDHEVTVLEESGDDEAGTYDTVNEGATVISTPQGEAEVSPGKFAFAPRNRASKPFFLATHPNFWARRQLRLEHRILQRKQFLQNNVEQLRNARIKHLLGLRGNKVEHKLKNLFSDDDNKEARRQREEKRRARKEAAQDE
jgi:hypothetical protein